MKNNKKKKIILISTIGAIALIVIILLILFFTTDLFRSSQQLFYKYLPQNSQLIDIISSDLFTSHKQKMKQNSYTSNGEISLTYAMEGTENQEDTATNMELFKVITEGKTDNTNQKQYYKATLTKNNQELLSAKYLRANNLYALGSDQVVTKYVAVDNNNLKELVTKLGYEDVSQIPNQIEQFDVNNLQLTEEEKNVILKNYGTLIVNNIAKENFNKEENLTLTIDGQNYKTNKYTLTLTTQEIKNLVTVVLQQIQNDEQILTILLSKYHVLVQNDAMTTERLKEQIQQMEQGLNGKTIEDTDVQISLYVSGETLIKTEIGVRENRISIQYVSGARGNKIVIKDEMNTIGQFNTLELEKLEDSEQYALSIILSNTEDTQKTITLQISRVGNANSTTIRKLDILTIKEGNNVYTLRYGDNINFENEIQVDELNQDNSITLNNCSQEELQQLIPAIIQRSQQVWQEAITKIGFNEESSLESISDINQEDGEQIPEENEESQQNETTLTSTEKLAIEMYNEQFLTYLGESIQADQVKQLLTVARTAIQNQNTITVKYTGTYNNTQVEKEVTTAEEMEELEVYIVNGKNYKVEGLADITGKLAELTIQENVKNT